MKQRVHTEITINASAETVWNILTDLPSYCIWNPFIRNAEGRIGLNEKLLCQPVLPGSKRQLSFRPTIIRYKNGEEFAWLGGIFIHPIIAGGEHIFQLKELSNDKVKLIHDQVFYGITGPIAKLFAGEKTRKGFILMNEALKEQAEMANNA